MTTEAAANVEVDM